MPTGQAAINTLVKPNERGAANSTYLTAYDLGVGVASLAAGFLTQKMSLDVIYRCATLPVLLSSSKSPSSLLPVPIR